MSYQGGRIGIQDPTCLLRHEVQEAGVAAPFPPPFPGWGLHPAVHEEPRPALRRAKPRSPAQRAPPPLSEIVGSSLTRGRGSPWGRRRPKCPACGGSGTTGARLCSTAPRRDVKDNKAERRDKGEATGKRRGPSRAELHPPSPQIHMRSPQDGTSRSNEATRWVLTQHHWRPYKKRLGRRHTQRVVRSQGKRPPKGPTWRTPPSWT